MAQKSKSFKVFCLLDCFALLLVLFANLFSLVTQDSAFLEILSSGAILIAAAVSVFYVLDGCRKADAPYFRLYLVFFALCKVFELLSLPRYLILLILSFLCVCMLAQGKNLGKKTSIVYALLACGFDLLRAVLCLVADGLDVVSVHSVSNLILSLTVVLVVFAKYQDKAARGST